MIATSKPHFPLARRHRNHLQTDGETYHPRTRPKASICWMKRQLRQEGVRLPTTTHRDQRRSTTRPEEVSRNPLSSDCQSFFLSTYSVCRTPTHSSQDLQTHRQGQERGPKTPLPQQRQLLLLRRTRTLLSGLSQTKMPVVQQNWTFPSRLLEAPSNLRRRTTQ